MGVTTVSGSKIAKSTQEQAVAAWVDFRNVLRFQELAEKLAKQDINFEAAMAELQKLKIFVADPQHILGSLKSKHGEIAEHVQVHFVNAERQIVGQAANHTFDGVGRLAPRIISVSVKWCSQNFIWASAEHSMQ